MVLNDLSHLISPGAEAARLSNYHVGFDPRWSQYSLIQLTSATGYNLYASGLTASTLILTTECNKDCPGS